jgi:enoyl-CoA hydratase
MTLHEMSVDRMLSDLTAGPTVPLWAQPGRGDVVMVPIDDTDPAPAACLTAGGARTLPSNLSAVVIGTRSAAGEGRHRNFAPLADVCDAVVEAGSGDLESIVRRVAEHPLASTAFVQVLRGAEARSIGEGLLLESAVYSALQAGPEFARWRVGRSAPTRAEVSGPTVRARREDDVLYLELHRPHVHNALNAAMRDDLLELLELVAVDDSIRQVVVTGAGPSYCAGGDLDEFGSFDDPAHAHLVRSAASIGAVLHRLRERVVMHLHGSCIGSGIELPAFVDDVRAETDLRVRLPELEFGLIPGAGGTWSLPHRIGRHRTAWLGLTGHTIDLATAQEWGLVTATSP